MNAGMPTTRPELCPACNGSRYVWRHDIGDPPGVHRHPCECQAAATPADAPCANAARELEWRRELEAAGIDVDAACERLQQTIDAGRARLGAADAPTLRIVISVEGPGADDDLQIDAPGIAKEQVVSIVSRAAEALRCPARPGKQCEDCNGAGCPDCCYGEVPATPADAPKPALRELGDGCDDPHCCLPEYQRGYRAGHTACFDTMHAEQEELTERLTTAARARIEELEGHIATSQRERDELANVIVLELDAGPCQEHHAIERAIHLLRYFKGRVDSDVQQRIANRKVDTEVIRGLRERLLVAERDLHRKTAAYEELLAARIGGK